MGFIFTSFALGSSGARCSNKNPLNPNKIMLVYLHLKGYRVQPKKSGWRASCRVLAECTHRGAMTVTLPLCHRYSPNVTERGWYYVPMLVPADMLLHLLYDCLKYQKYCGLFMPIHSLGNIAQGKSNDVREVLCCNACASLHAPPFPTTLTEPIRWEELLCYLVVH